MLDQFKHLYKYRIQFSSDTKIGYVNVTTMGNKNDAINLFLKHCRLQHPVVIDCKFISIVIDKGGSGQIGTLTFEVNDEAVGTFSGEDKVIDIEVPTKMSQLVNDSSYITRDELTGDLIDEIKEEIEEELGGDLETTNNKVQVISGEGSETEYPSTKAVIDYINSLIMPKLNLIDSSINDINSLIPSQADSSNKLVDKASLDSSINEIYDVITNNELVTAQAFNDINSIIPSQADSSNKLVDRASFDSSLNDINSSINDINDVLPSQASSSNKLVDKASFDSSINDINSSINDINDVIPSQADSSNKLVDKASLDSSINDIYDVITDNELVTAQAFNDIKEEINETTNSNS